MWMLSRCALYHVAPIVDLTEIERLLCDSRTAWMDKHHSGRLPRHD